MGYSNKRGARVLGVMRPKMQLSFLFDCDDVALPALKLDPDTELACVVPAHRGPSGECSCDRSLPHENHDLKSNIQVSVKMFESDSGAGGKKMQRFLI